MTILAKSRGKLLTGVARVDITPEDPTQLMATGLPRREPAMSGVTDPLTVGAMALEVGGEAWIVLTSDLRRIWYTWVHEVRRRVGERLGIDGRRVLFSAVHNHSSSPIAADAESRAAVEAAERKIVDGFVAAATEAFQTRREAELCAIGAELAEPVGGNRRMTLSTGTVSNCWHAGGIVPPGAKIAGRAGPAPTRVSVVAAREPGAAEPFGLLVSYASHPHLIGVPYFGGELAGGVRRAVESRLDGATVLYANATGGDQDLHAAFPVPETDGAGEVAWALSTFDMLGRRVADAVVPAVAACDMWRDAFDVRHLYWSEGEEAFADAVDCTMDQAMQQPMTIVNLLALGDVVLAEMPGEMSHVYGERIVAASGFRETVLLGYNGSNNAYLLTPLDAERGGYEVMHGFSPGADPGGPVALMPCGRRVKPTPTTGDAVCAKIIELLGEL